MSHNSERDADERYIRRAYELARAAADNGNEPFGAVLVVDDEVVAEAENTVNTDDDIAAHPELKLARWAGRELAPAECGRATLYTSTEPCSMCAGGLFIAGVGRVVYGVTAETAHRASGADEVVPPSDILERGEAIEVRGPVRPDEGEAIHRECWDHLA